MIDLYAIECELAAIEAESIRLGMPRALLDHFSDLRTKVFPALVKLREQEGRRNS